MHPDVAKVGVQRLQRSEEWGRQRRGNAVAARRQRRGVAWQRGGSEVVMAWQRGDNDATRACSTFSNPTALGPSAGVPRMKIQLPARPPGQGSLANSQALF